MHKAQIAARKCSGYRSGMKTNIAQNQQTRPGVGLGEGGGGGGQGVRCSLNTSYIHCFVDSGCND